MATFPSRQPPSPLLAGIAHAFFATEGGATKALRRDGQYIGNRYVRLKRATGVRSPGDEEGGGVRDVLELEGTPQRSSCQRAFFSPSQHSQGDWKPPKLNKNKGFPAWRNRLGLKIYAERQNF